MERTFRYLRADEIDCRIGSIKEDGLTLLLYKDARCDMNILDETFGPFGWQRRHCRDNANCIVSIYDIQKNEWIEKEDTGTESNTEAEKGLASDSFKRACFNWGIGRELYTAPFIWISSSNCEIKKQGSKLYCYDKFKVSEIGYGENGEINRLIITNRAKGVDVFEYPRKSKYSIYTHKIDIQPIEGPDGYYLCSDCGKEITAVKLDSGKTLDHREVAKRTIKKYGKQLCKECCKNAVPIDGSGNQS